MADGVGGHLGGDVASSMAVEIAESVISFPPSAGMKPGELVARAFAEASQRIFDKAACEKPGLFGMGTTMVLLYCSGQSIFIGNAGDSRCYLFRKPYLWQLTEDHSMVNEHLKAGLINEAQVKQFTGRNIITRSVGYEKDVSVDILERPLMRGDTFLLCSDGLSGLVSDKKIAMILSENDYERSVDLCIEEALTNGGTDNVTVLTLSII